MKFGRWCIDDERRVSARLEGVLETRGWCLNGSIESRKVKAYIRKVDILQIFGGSKFLKNSMIHETTGNVNSHRK